MLMSLGPGLCRMWISENTWLLGTRVNASSTVARPPKHRHIDQTVKARGFAYATCCTLRPHIACYVAGPTSVMYR